jgi:phosphoadenosine phosphosulfate reductase
MHTEQVQSVINLLKQIETEHQPSAFACSFGLEDMVLLDLIAKHAPRIEVFTLDTGRLPDETHALLEQVREIYTIPIRLYFPDATMVENWVAQNGTNGFYRSMSQRKQCCEIRKVVPLGRALAGKKAWITGLRREQSNARQTLKLQEWDEGNGLHKFNPLVDWTWDEVWAYVKQYKLPYNALHDRGYPAWMRTVHAPSDGQEFGQAAGGGRHRQRMRLPCGATKRRKILRKTGHISKRSKADRYTSSAK